MLLAAPAAGAALDAAAGVAGAVEPLAGVVGAAVVAAPEALVEAAGGVALCVVGAALAEGAGGFVALPLTAAPEELGAEAEPTALALADAAELGAFPDAPLAPVP